MNLSANETTSNAQAHASQADRAGQLKTPLAHLYVAVRAAHAAVQPAVETADRIENGISAQISRVPVPEAVQRVCRRVIERSAWSIAVLSGLLSVGAYAWYSSHGLTLAYTDAISHMEIARRVVAGRTPGLAQLGSVWLPLHHLLMLPLIASYTLFHDGLAGAFASMAAYVVGSVYLYRTGRLLLGSCLAGWVAALAFMLNPNVLYMQGTAMTESDMLAAAILAVFYLLRWTLAYHPLDLAKASAAIMAGTLVRYDAWALALAAAAVVVYVAWRRQGRKAAEAYVLVFGLLAFAGGAAWVLYNGVIFHNPLYFYNSMYSTQAQQRSIEVHAGLPTHNNLVLSAHVYGQTVIDSVWWPLAALALIGLLYWFAHSQLRMREVAGYLVLVPLAFNVLALVRGISVVVTPEIPFGSRTYFNVRYGMMMIPAVALCLAVLAAQRRTLAVLVLALIMVFGIGDSTLGSRATTPYVVLDPVYGVGVAGRLTGIQAGKWLADHYHGGNVMITYSHDSAIMFDSGLPDSDFLTEANGAQFRYALAHPQNAAAWIVLAPGGGNDEIAAGLGARHVWQRYFVLKQVIGGTQFYERIGNS